MGRIQRRIRPAAGYSLNLPLTNEQVLYQTGKEQSLFYRRRCRARTMITHDIEISRGPQP